MFQDSKDYVPKRNRWNRLDKVQIEVYYYKMSDHNKVHIRSDPLSNPAGKFYQLQLKDRTSTLEGGHRSTSEGLKNV